MEQITLEDDVVSTIPVSRHWAHAVSNLSKYRSRRVAGLDRLLRALTRGKTAGLLRRTPRDAPSAGLSSLGMYTKRKRTSLASTTWLAIDLNTRRNAGAELLPLAVAPKTNFESTKTGMRW